MGKSSISVSIFAYRFFSIVESIIRIFSDWIKKGNIFIKEQKSKAHLAYIYFALPTVPIYSKRQKIYLFSTFKFS